MRNYLFRILRMIFGSMVFALGTVITMDGNVGYGPWDCFHYGISLHVPLKMGMVSIVVGLVLILIDFLLKEAIGIATIINLLVVGVFIDFFRDMPIHPHITSFFLGILYMLFGLFVAANGSFLYLGSGLGNGARDGIMVAIRRHVKLSIGISRFVLEMTAAVIGWILGGPFGVGTFLYALGLGSMIQLVFHMYRFEATKVQHDSLKDTVLFFKNCIMKNANTD